ncbi:stringent starvation protein A [Pseudohongiella nitratireducens]|jgi:RNA polymerase-associated protein|uniref:Stringent starvation protein A n=1 Tax=Pseudohongiella nitratireducens TaxID=1768907 RepID=A0A916VIZ4_9GAMM|nr:glutathione S-transferase N-terminal domain-containing protein [Pseudohongiella nitratireducens]MDF1624467.1 glutathione S-transferase N-terminal domain-containing protein [Pseudohongiella nitratireducens]GFZ78715.1 stringent starvation protein A [Pseudohongiella nitratireducens]|tara:strand:- start:5321 stop:5953 length:633 start_codon:yes stop_codon:yes gene_type:complete
MGVVSKRSSMTFYSDGNSQYSHRVRIVLAEKGVTVDTISVDPENPPEDLLSLNPYGSLPTLVDRDLVLYEANIMMEYLDERFPHPPLFPVYPVARAQSRLWMYRIQRDWCVLVDKLVAGEGSAAQQDKIRKELRESLTSIAPIFAEKPFFMSDEFTIVDCCVAPILWRLQSLGIELGNQKALQPLLQYRARLFSRDSIRSSLSEQEKEMV